MTHPSQLFPEDTVRAFADVLAPRLGPDEYLPDVLAGGFELADRRAALLGRRPTPLDAEFAFSLFCRWPFKPPPSASYRSQIEPFRVEAFARVSSGQNQLLHQAVPDETLMLSHEQLFEALESGDAARLFRIPMIG